MHSDLFHAFSQVKTSQQFLFLFVLSDSIAPPKFTELQYIYFSWYVQIPNVHPSWFLPPCFYSLAVLPSNAAWALDSWDCGMLELVQLGTGEAASPGRRDVRTVVMDETISSPPLVSSPWQRLNQKSQRKPRCWRHKRLQHLVLGIVDLIFGKPLWYAQEAVIQTIWILLEILLIHIHMKCSAFYLQFLFILQVVDGTDICIQCHDQPLH